MLLLRDRPQFFYFNVPWMSSWKEKLAKLYPFPFDKNPTKFYVFSTSDIIGTGWGYSHVIFCKKLPILLTPHSGHRQGHFDENRYSQKPYWICSFESFEDFWFNAKKISSIFEVGQILRAFEFRWFVYVIANFLINFNSRQIYAKMGTVSKNIIKIQINVSK